MSAFIGDFAHSLTVQETAEMAASIAAQRVQETEALQGAGGPAEPPPTDGRWDEDGEWESYARYGEVWNGSKNFLPNSALR